MSGLGNLTNQGTLWALADSTLRGYRLYQFSGDGFLLGNLELRTLLYPSSYYDLRLFGLLGTVLDRKSTRLNSSHVRISYAVFCLKKKNCPLMHGRCLMSDASLTVGGGRAMSVSSRSTTRSVPSERRGA